MLWSLELFAWAPGSATKHGTEPLSKAERKEAIDAGFVLTDREERPGVLMRDAFQEHAFMVSKEFKGEGRLRPVPSKCERLIEGKINYAVAGSRAIVLELLEKVGQGPDFKRKQSHMALKYNEFAMATDGKEPPGPEQVCYLTE